jgi:hypothetical protein
MKVRPDINDALRAGGPDAVRARHDKARKYTGRGLNSSHNDGLRPPSSGLEKAKTQETKTQPPLPFINMSNWDNEPVPEQDWVVLNRIPRRQCVLFSGEGSAGKSTEQLHLSAAHVFGRTIKRHRTGPPVRAGPDTSTA